MTVTLLWPRKFLLPIRALGRLKYNEAWQGSEGNLNEDVEYHFMIHTVCATAKQTSEAPKCLAWWCKGILLSSLLLLK